MGNDEVAPPEGQQGILQQDQGAQVEVIARFVEEEEIGVAQEHGGQFDAGLVAPREAADRALEQFVLDLVAGGRLPALPVLGPGRAHEEIEDRLFRAEGIVLLEVPEAERVVARDLPAVRRFLPGDDPAECGLAGPVSPDHPDFLIVGKGGRGPIQQDVVPVGFMDLVQLEEYGHW